MWNIGPKYGNTAKVPSNAKNDANADTAKMVGPMLELVNRVNVKTKLTNGLTVTSALIRLIKSIDATDFQYAPVV